MHFHRFCIDLLKFSNLRFLHLNYCFLQDIFIILIRMAGNQIYFQHIIIYYLST